VIVRGVVSGSSIPPSHLNVHNIKASARLIAVSARVGVHPDRSVANTSGSARASLMSAQLRGEARLFLHHRAASKEAASAPIRRPKPGGLLPRTTGIILPTVSRLQEESR